MGRILIGQALGLNDIENAMKNGEIKVENTTNAENATNDSQGNNIAETYVKILDFDRLILENEYPVGGSKPYIQFYGMQTPAERWAGTSWEIDTDYQGRMIIGSGGDYAFGSKGGSADAVIVKHTHAPLYGLQANGQNTPTANAKYFMGSTSANANYATELLDEAGVDGTNKNMPPYIAENIWKRTA